LITTPTTLVLGAGASMPYGFPSGVQLSEEIFNAYEGEIRNEMIYTKNFSEAELQKFTKTFKRSSAVSIDDFLSMNKQFAEIGKFCIASILLKREDENKVFNKQDDHWYQHFWEALTKGTQTAEDLKKNQIRIITFNYDRSLEYFLFESIKNYFGVQDFVALQIVEHFDIFHVYGSLGKFGAVTNEKENILQYAPLVDHTYNRYCHMGARCIKVINDDRVESSQFKKAHEWLDNSKKIGFLGFGFDDTNVKRLNLRNILKNVKYNSNNFPQKTEVIASVLGKTSKEIDQINSTVCFDDGIWYAFNQKNLMTIRESGLLMNF
jgi:hypothetical protein